MKFVKAVIDYGKQGNYQPIKDDQRTTDHRGRKYPVCQCPCLPCIQAWLCL